MRLHFVLISYTIWKSLLLIFCELSANIIKALIEEIDPLHEISGQWYKHVKL